MEPGARPTGWSRRGASPCATGAIAGVGPRRRGARGCRRARGARPRRAAGDAGADRLPHPRRLRRQPGARVRDAAERRELRGGRAGRRRHRLDGAGDAGGGRGGAARRRADAGRRADRRGGGGDRDQVGLRARPRRPSSGCCGWRARSAGERPVRVRTSFLGAHAVPPRARTADAYIDEVCIPTLRAAHGRGAGRRGRRLLRGHRLRAGAGGAGCSRRRASSACR